MQSLEYRSIVPPVYKKLIRQLEKSLDLEGRELESDWASVQVIRHTGMLPDGPYHPPSYFRRGTLGEEEGGRGQSKAGV